MPPFGWGKERGAARSVMIGAIPVSIKGFIGFGKRGKSGGNLPRNAALRHD
jgi:hypothetical protein